LLGVDGVAFKANILLYLSACQLLNMKSSIGSRKRVVQTSEQNRG